MRGCKHGLYLGEKEENRKWNGLLSCYYSAFHSLGGVGEEWPRTQGWSNTVSSGA